MHPMDFNFMYTFSFHTKSFFKIRKNLFQFPVKYGLKLNQFGQIEARGGTAEV